jgi:predicted nucleic acid-binding protein
MTDTLVDTNVLLDVNGPPSAWKAWSEANLADVAEEGRLLVNQVIYAELAAGYGRREELDAVLGASQVRVESIPWAAAFAAGVAFLKYLRRGGSRGSPLPDFFIGAHAAVAGYRLLTRDRGYYATYFPTLKLISPETHP